MWDYIGTGTSPPVEVQEEWFLLKMGSFDVPNPHEA